MKKMLRTMVVLAMVVFMTGGAALAAETVVGVDANFMPFEFKVDGKLTGFDVDLFEAIAKEIGLDFKWQTMDFNGIIPGLQSKSIDAAIAGITIKSEREKVVDFSHPYYDSGLIILVAADNEDIKVLEDLKGKRVATKLATTSEDYLKKNVDTKELKLLPNTDNLFMELMSGGVDAVFFDSPPLLYFADNQGKGKVKTVGPLYQGQPYGIAFPEGSPLREKVNIALLKFMEDGTYDKLYEKWFGTAPK
ncbi:MAG: glutamine ABC transporter substrate-binding protein GlnH [Thermodesulfobacteriota bacterium]